jgi:hypothetical protein
MVKYPDFLRHIVNVKLSEYSIKRKKIIPIIDEVRKLIAKAENRYRFSSFGGNPENLAKYLKSDDFKLVISAFESAGALDILIDILRVAREKYSDLPVVAEAIDEAVKSIEARIEEKGEGSGK